MPDPYACTCEDGNTCSLFLAFFLLCLRFCCQTHLARSVIAICTHALLSGDAYEKIEKSKLKKLITSDSIEIKKESKKIEHLTCSKIFAEAMYNVHHNKSIDKLFIN